MFLCDRHLLGFLLAYVSFTLSPSWTVSEKVSDDGSRAGRGAGGHVVLCHSCVSLGRRETDGEWEGARAAPLEDCIDHLQGPHHEKRLHTHVQYTCDLHDL